MEPLIAEDVLLLLLDDDSGAFLSGSNASAVLAGAVLAELALTGAAEVETESGRWRRTQVVVEQPHEVTDPVLVAALDAIGEKRRSPQDLVGHIGKQLPERLCARLAERGILRREDSKILGLFPRTRWPAEDSQREQALRGQLQRALVGGEDPDVRTAVVVAVLNAADLVPRVVDRGAMSKRDLKARAEEIAAGSWATEAVRKALDAASQAMMMAAVFAATTVATTS
jgi:hypothetical protein